MKSIKLFALLLFSALLLTGCGLKNSEVIVKVNDRAITQADYDKLFNQTVNNPALQMFGLDAKNVDKNSFMYLMLKDRVVNELIIRSLIDEEMEKRHIVVTKKDAEAELQSIIAKVGSKAKFNEILKQNGVTLSEFKQDLAEEVKMKKLVDMLQKVTVSEAEAKTYYNQNLSKFKYPDKVRASHILIAANVDEMKEVLKADSKNAKLTDAELNALVQKQMAEKLKLAQAILAEVQKDQSAFAKIAKDKSEDVESAKQGGDLGFFSKQEMVDEFSKVAFTMKPNTVSGVVKTPYGYHIIMVTDRKAAGQDSFEKVKQDIISYLENQKKVKVLENFIESLKKNAKIEYVNKDFNPTDIQEALKSHARQNSAAAEQVDSANHTATPVAVPEKK
ncbi:MAG: peptidylprolyl isomerase [Candidatus Gastranaerophilaceae bacterium]